MQINAVIPEYPLVSPSIPCNPIQSKLPQGRHLAEERVSTAVCGYFLAIFRQNDSTGANEKDVGRADGNSEGW